MLAAQYVFDTPVAAFDHTVGLRVHRRREAMLDAAFGAKRVELMCTTCGTLAQAKQAVAELLAVIGQNRAYAYRARAF